MDSGSLKEINFGIQKLSIIVKSNIIFAFLVEDMDPLIERYMYLIVDDFIANKKEDVDSFNGDVSIFNDFDKNLENYFKI